MADLPPPPRSASSFLITSLSGWGGGDAQGGGGDARASCASPLGTPLGVDTNLPLGDVVYIYLMRKTPESLPKYFVLLHTNTVQLRD